MIVVWLGRLTSSAVVDAMVSTSLHKVRLDPTLIGGRRDTGSENDGSISGWEQFSAHVAVPFPVATSSSPTTI